MGLTANHAAILSRRGLRALEWFDSRSEHMLCDLAFWYCLAWLSLVRVLYLK